MDDHCKTCAHYGDNRGEYDWCHMCEMEVDHYKPMDDLISRKVAMDTFMEKPYDYYHTSYIVGELNCIPSVPAVPLDKLCELLAKFRITIPCTFCPRLENDYCTAPCPSSKEKWMEAITKWMEEDGNDK